MENLKEPYFSRKLLCLIGILSYIRLVLKICVCGVSADKLFFVPSMTNMSFDHLTISTYEKRLID